MWLQQEDEREAAAKPAKEGARQVEEKDKEERFIGERKLGTVTVDTGTTIAAFKSRIFEELIKGKEGLSEELKINTVDDFRLRNAIKANC